LISALPESYGKLASVNLCGAEGNGGLSTVSRG